MWNVGRDKTVKNLGGGSVHLPFGALRWEWDAFMCGMGREVVGRLHLPFGALRWERDAFR